VISIYQSIIVNLLLFKHPKDYHPMTEGVMGREPAKTGLLMHLSSCSNKSRRAYKTFVK
jgi:hypothetical protein